MIQTLLLILKIIGILLLCVLGLLLVLLLALLFVPVRYELKGSWPESPWGEGGVFWLLHAFSLRAGYMGNGTGLWARVKLFGFTVWKLKTDTPSSEEEAEEEERPLSQEEKELYRELQEDEKAFSGKKEQPPVIPSPSPKENEPSPEEQPPKSSLWERLCSTLQSFARKLRFSFQAFCDKLKDIENFAAEKKAWLENEKNQASLRLLFKQIKRLIAHLWPKKGQGTVTFGFDDPYTTGQVLSAASLIYPFFHKQLQLYSVFDEKVLSAEGSFRGRVRAAYVLWLFWGIFRDRHTWRMLRNLMG